VALTHSPIAMRPSLTMALLTTALFPWSQALPARNSLLVPSRKARELPQSWQLHC
jgi:hypothetical protein